jgi:hypothetical protein
MNDADVVDVLRHYRIMARLRRRISERGVATPEEVAWADRALADASARLARLGILNPRHLHVVRDEQLGVQGD